MTNCEEEILAAANSIWVYLDSETGRPTRIPQDYAVTSGYGMEPPYPMEYRDRKVEIPELCREYPSFTVIKSNIDSYNHVNNGQYIKMAEEYLPETFFVETMRVEYKMQALLGDIIIPLVSETDSCYTIVLADQSKKPYAVVEFTGKHTRQLQKGN
jgi:acyl-ACP thioesterase